MASDISAQLAAAGAQAASLGASLLQDQPGKDPLSIGPVTFNSTECPSKLPIGALEQKIVVKELIGGGRDTQSLGAQPKDVQWSGTFFQPNVDSRVTTLLSMAKGGKEYLLSWRIYRFYCKVKDFTPAFSNANVCPYDITVEITRDANGSLSAIAPVGIDDQAKALTNGAQAQLATITAADPVGASPLNAVLSQVQSSIIAAGPLAQLAGPGLQSVLLTIGSALSAAQSYAQAQSEDTPQFIAAQHLVSSLILLEKNLAQGQSQNVLRVQGASVFEVASMVYGDVSQAFALMQANGMISPFTSRQVSTTIALPPLPKQ